MPLRKRCFIKDCHVHNSESKNDGNRVAYFNVPKTLLKTWQDIIKKPQLSASSKICSRHFDATDIFKGRTIQNVFYPYRVWRLKPGAIPKHFLGLNTSNNLNALSGIKESPQLFPPELIDEATFCQSMSVTSADKICLDKTLVTPSSSFVVQVPQKPALHCETSKLLVATTAATLIQPPPILPLSEPCRVLASSQVPTQTCGTLSDAVRSSLSTASHSTDYVKAKIPLGTPTLDIENFAQLAKIVKLPSPGWVWSFHEENKHMFCSSHQFSTSGKLLIKSVQILNKNQALFFINGRSISALILKREFQSQRGLSEILAAFDSKKPCIGIQNQSLDQIQVSEKVGGVREGGVWRSKQCDVFTDKKNLCSKCRSLKIYLMKKKRAPPKDENRHKRKLRTCQNKIQRMTRRKEEMMATINRLEKEKAKLVQANRINGFDSKVKRLNEKEQMIVKAMVSKSEARLGRNNVASGIRYERAFLQECEIIRGKSSTVYRYLRNNAILPLPSITTLDRLRRKASKNSSVAVAPEHPETEIILSTSETEENEREHSLSPVMTLEIIATGT